MIKENQEDHYYAYGMKMGGMSYVFGTQNKFVYTGKELQDDISLNQYDFGARQYDPVLGRWHVVDQLAELNKSLTPYNYISSNPLNRMDPDGRWDITVHVYSDRSVYGYGIAIVTDRYGNEVYRFDVRVEGIGGRDRMVSYSDTPLCKYDIPNRNMWLSSSEDDRDSYGPNPRLILNGESGEIIDSERDGIRFHGGRQETYNENTGEWEDIENPTLTKTKGCLRCYDEDMNSLKTVTDYLNWNDPLEVGGKTTVVDDLVESNGEYVLPTPEPSILPSIETDIPPIDNVYVDPILPIFDPE